MVNAPDKVDALTMILEHYRIKRSTSTYQDTRYKPDNSGQEAERFGGLPATTQVIVPDIAPVKGTAAGEAIQSIDLETESGEPAKCDDDINWDVLATVFS